MYSADLTPELLFDVGKYLPESIDIARQILIYTQKLFINGSASRLQDYAKNPNVLSDLAKVRSFEINAEVKSELDVVINGVTAAYYFKAGNCGEMTDVAMYHATYFSENLTRVEYLGIENYDHALLKLQFKNNDHMYIDPWYLNSSNHGIIFDEINRENYFKKIEKSLRVKIYIPSRLHLSLFICATSGLIFLYLKDELEELYKIILYWIFVALSLSFICLFHKTNISHDFITREYLEDDVGANQEASFHSFQERCNTELDKRHLVPLLFSTRIDNDIKQNNTVLEFDIEAQRDETLVCNALKRKLTL